MGDLPTFIPFDPEHTHDVITVPNPIVAEFQKLMDASFITETYKSSTGSAQTYRKETEQAGTIVLDEKTRILDVINKHPGQSGASSPDRDVPAGKKLLGTFHTHPYVSGVTGALDAMDALDLINSNDIFMIAQSGREQFMFVKTSKSHLYKGGMQHLMDLASELLKETTYDDSFPFAFEAVSDRAARRVAKLCQLAYYKGRDGMLKRQFPPPPHKVPHGKR
jgi:hypothetical protein